MLWWMVACGGGPDCETGPDGYCAPEGGEDLDGDGFSVAEGDCDDARADLNPADADGDGYSTCQGDCDEDSPDAARRGPAVDEPPFVETCDNVDNDCDLVIDEDAGGRNPCLETRRQNGTRWTSLDLLVMEDTDVSFQAPSAPVHQEMPRFLDVFAETDTRVALLDSRAADARLIAVDGRRWVSLLDASPAEATRFLSAGSGVSSGRSNRPLTRAVEAVALPENAELFRRGDRTLTAVFVHTNTDERETTAAEFLAAFDGQCLVFGPDPTDSCGIQAAPRLEGSATAGYFPNCGDHVGEDLLTAAATLVPARIVSKSWLDEGFDVLPATRRAVVTRVDGTVVELGPVDLDWDSLTWTVTVRDYVWADLSAVDFQIQRVP